MREAYFPFFIEARALEVLDYPGSVSLPILLVHTCTKARLCRKENLLLIINPRFQHNSLSSHIGQPAVMDKSR